MAEGDRDKKLVNPVSITASTAILDAPMGPTATLIIASQL
jgi:hypothetical protein